MPADEVFADPEVPSALANVAPEAQERAIDAACERFGAARDGDIHRSIMRRSLGLRVRAADGSPSWLKISRQDEPLRKAAIQRERKAQALKGVPMPPVLQEAEWTADGIGWHAFRFGLAPSPAAQPTPWIAGPMPEISDRWLAGLKDASGHLSGQPLSEWLVHPGTIARVISQRYGGKAPYEVDEWRVAHGDLNWCNITAPELSLLDWERWGVAPRGYDIASLLCFSVTEPELYRRIETAFSSDLETPSGLVARLYLLARRLNRIEAGNRDPREHSVIEREAERLLRR